MSASRLSVAIGLAGIVAAAVTAVAPSAVGSAGAGCIVGRWQKVGDDKQSLAVESGPAGVDAFASPHAGTTRIRHFAAYTAEGVTQVFLVEASKLGRDCRASWYRVSLPLRPNGHAGYIPAAGLHPYLVTTRLVVSVGARRLELYQRGHLRLRLTVGVGRASAPTPTGSFYVQERLRTTASGGPYGPGALGLSAYSPTLTDWVRGGPVAIHGTDDPSSIGAAISHGCVRVQNTSMTTLLSLVTPGSPIVIQP